MPTVLSHPAVPLAIALGTGGEVTPPRPLLAGVICSVLPDLDSVGFWAGVPYEHLFGHRGFSHSLFFALVVGLLGWVAASSLNVRPTWAFLFLFIGTASHGLLDTLTNGGLGIALLSPFSNRRFFFPWRPIPVSPIGLGGFLSRRGLAILTGELFLLWLPLFRSPRNVSWRAAAPTRAS